MSGSYCNLAVPRSILDTDLYKLTMQQAVLCHFPNHYATYEFTNRNKDVFFTRTCFDKFRAAIAPITEFTDLKLTEEEQLWLQRTCPYFKADYLEFLARYRFKPEQVQVTFHPEAPDGLSGRIQMRISGPWVETILWEVPLMACFSETYFQTVDTDWNYEGQAELACSKAKSLLGAGCAFSEFGTRRRRSFHVQDLVVQNFMRASGEIPSGTFLGTSNVYLAFTYGIDPIGTIAHEWFMGIAALRGYEYANTTALTLWEEVYSDRLTIALTDTFSTEAFFKSFGKDPDRAHRWTGLRQDSGDPFAFAPRAKAIYDNLNIDTRQKLIVYSDALDIVKCVRLKQQCDQIGFKCSFGIGTFLTNDFFAASTGKKSKALNIVIKLAFVDNKPCVKISDDLTKNTGDKATVAHVKQIFGLPIQA